jgi:Flp pilus assembly secretin CpaC
MTSRLGVGGRTFLVAASIGLFATGAAFAQAPEVIDVTIDFAKVLKLEDQAKTIVIGNPGIADAAVEDESTVVLTGKAAGATNLIVLNAEGDEVVNAVLRVSSNVQQLTTVFYGSQRQTFSCAPTCEQVILVGDEPDVFKVATEQIQGRQQFATGQ